MLRLALALTSLGSRRGFSAVSISSDSLVTVNVSQPVLALTSAVGLSAPELSSAAKDLIPLMPSLDAQGALGWLKIFHQKGVRHEGVMLAAAWNVFKSVMPQPNVNGMNSSEVNQIREITAAVCSTFRIITEQRFVHDHILLIAAVGKCIECAPAMEPAQLADVMVGLRCLDRLTLTQAEAANYASGTATPAHLADPLLADNHLRDSCHQVNMIDILSEVLENRLVECHRRFSAQQIVDVVETLSVLGVGRSETIKALGAAFALANADLSQLTALLTSTIKLHEKVVDALDHHPNSDDKNELRNLCGPLFAAVSNFLSNKRISEIVEKHPRLILQLRKVCEECSASSEYVPELWEKVRCLRIAHRHTIPLKKLESKLPKSALSKLPLPQRKREHDISRSQFKDRFTPVQFRKTSVGRVFPRRKPVSTTIGIGNQRIKKGFLKKVADKHTKFY